MSPTIWIPALIGLLIFGPLINNKKAYSYNNKKAYSQKYKKNSVIYLIM